jgi:hypothetical protein
MKEKEVLLEEVSSVIEKHSISITIVRNITLAIFFSLVILFPKIYIANHIYIYSLKINKLLNEYSSLEEEKSILLYKIEKIEFKSRVEKSF